MNINSLIQRYVEKEDADGMFNEEKDCCCILGAVNDCTDCDFHKCTFGTIVPAHEDDVAEFYVMDSDTEIDDYKNVIHNKWQCPKCIDIINCNCPTCGGSGEVMFEWNGQVVGLSHVTYFCGYFRIKNPKKMLDEQHEYRGHKIILIPWRYR